MFLVVNIRGKCKIGNQQELGVLSCSCYEGESRADYFLFIVSFLEHLMSESKLNEMISKHFSMEIQSGIITVGLPSVKNYLRKIYETYLFNDFGRWRKDYKGVNKPHFNLTSGSGVIG